MKIKEITVFTGGDSRKISTWSGIPYFLTRQLELEGIKVNRVNITPNRYLNWLYNHSVFPLRQKFHPGTEYNYIRSHLYRFLTCLKVLIYQILYKDADIDLMLTYSINVIYRRERTTMLCDWTLEQYIKNQLKRPLYKEEENYQEYETHCLKKVKHVLSLFPVSASYLTAKLGKEVKYLGSNVVNNCYEGTVSPGLIEKKYERQLLLFVGRSAYAKGAQLLLDSFLILQKNFPKLELHFVGITSDTLQITEIPSNVYFHGYLKKEIDSDKALYYDLLTQATVFVNPTQEWGGYSSTIEAMYFYTPVIVAPYNEFVSEFGDTIDFGHYINDYSVEKLTKAIGQCLGSDRETYFKMANDAHERVANHTWDKYTKLLLNILY